MFGYVRMHMHFVYPEITGQKQIMRVKVQSKQDVNDPEVQATILNKVRLMFHKSPHHVDDRKSISIFFPQVTLEINILRYLIRNLFLFFRLRRSWRSLGWQRTPQWHGESNSMERCFTRKKKRMLQQKVAPSTQVNSKLLAVSQIVSEV